MAIATTNKASGIQAANSLRLLRRAVWLVLVGVTILFAVRIRPYLPDEWGAFSKSLLLISGGGALFGVAGRFLLKASVVDFLNSTEAELRKVTWPKRESVKNGVQLVIGTVLLMCVFVFCIDQLWRIVFTAIGFLDLKTK